MMRGPIAVVATSSIVPLLIRYEPGQPPESVGSIRVCAMPAPLPPTSSANMNPAASVDRRRGRSHRERVAKNDGFFTPGAHGYHDARDSDQLFEACHVPSGVGGKIVQGAGAVQRLLPTRE